MRNIISSPFRKLRNNIRRRKLKNRNFTILSSECAGGVIYHDLGLRFDSPTINLWFKPSDYITFLKNLDYYLNTNILFEDKKANLDYPVGILGEKGREIRLYFQHYDNFKDAKQKWNRRKKRVHLDNLYLIMTDRDGASEHDLAEFDTLPYKNKVIFIGRKHKNLKHAWLMEDCLEDGHLGDIFKRSKLTGKSKLDTFDFVSFLNDGSY